MKSCLLPLLGCSLVVNTCLAQTHAPTAPAASSSPTVAGPETIVVTGTFRPTPETEIDRAVSIVDMKDGQVLYRNWVDALDLIPSIDFRQRAPNDIQGDLSIRGSSFGQTLVLLDGLRMDDVQTGHHDMDLAVPTPSVARLEILRGAGSTLYGSDAMAGAANIITVSPEHSDLRLGAGVGNFGFNQQSGSASLLWKKFSTQLDGERDFSSGFRPDRDYRSLTLLSHSSLDTDLGHSLLLLAYGDKPYGADQFYGPFPSWERTKSWVAGLKQEVGKETELDFGFRRHSDEFVLFRHQPSIYENNHIDESWQADLRRHQSIGENSAAYYGAEGIHENITSNNLGDHDRSRGALYFDYDVRALKRFSFSLAAREEVLSASHGEFNPTGAAGVWLTTRLKLKASLSRAFRLPSYTDLYYHDPANFGNPNLRPENAWDYEGGLEWSPGRLRSELTVFYRRDRNVIDYVRSASSAPYVAENIQRLNFTGIEISGDVRLKQEEHIHLAYTELHGVAQALAGLQTKYAFDYPAHEGVLDFIGRLPGKLAARTRVGVVDRYGADPYGLWDFAVGREFRHLASHLVLSNITDTQYQEIPGVVLPGRSVVFGVDYFWHAR